MNLHVDGYGQLPGFITSDARRGAAQRRLVRAARRDARDAGDGLAEPGAQHHAARFWRRRGSSLRPRPA